MGYHRYSFTKVGLLYPSHVSRSMLFDSSIPAHGGMLGASFFLGSLLPAVLLGALPDGMSGSTTWRGRNRCRLFQRYAPTATSEMSMYRSGTRHTDKPPLCAAGRVHPHAFVGFWIVSTAVTFSTHMTADSMMRSNVFLSCVPPAAEEGGRGAGRDDVREHHRYR